jgi:hypothetical protein
MPNDNVGQPSTPASTPAPQSSPIPQGAKVVSGGEARPKEVSPDSYKPEPRLNQTSFMEKLKKHNPNIGKKKIVEQSPAAEKTVTTKQAEEKVDPPAADAKEVVIENQTGEEISVTNEEKTEPAAFKAPEKFMSLGKEYDLPKWAQDAIKDPNSEKEVKEIFEKAIAVDRFKEKNKEISDKYESLNKTHLNVMSGIQDLKAIYAETLQTRNWHRMDDFFKRLQIPIDVVLQYAAEKVSYMELPPDQRALIDGQQEAQRRARELETQSRHSQNSAFEAEVRTRRLLLDAALAKPDISTVVQRFESAPGRKPGDFRIAVAEHAEYTWHKTQGKVDLSAEDAINEVIQKYGLTATSAPSQPAPQAPAPQQNAPTAPKVPAPHQPVPVIPSISGRSSSPTKQPPKSIADLRKLGKAARKG